MSARRNRITDEAALWLAQAQDSDFPKAAREEFASWLAASSEHVQEYLSLVAISRDFREVFAPMDADALVALARESGKQGNVVELPGAEARLAAKSSGPGKRLRRKQVWAGAAALLIAAAAGLFFASGPTVYSTGIGEQASFSLQDGSVVVLNAQSSLELDYTQSERTARLASGEALFNVKEDPARPFQVVTELALIRAVGTSFNVRQRDGKTAVTVVAGIVDVQSLDAWRDDEETRPNREGAARLPGGGGAAAGGNAPAGGGGLVRLTAGQQARIEEQAAGVVVIDANIETATSWRERRLVFESRALSEVAAEFNLYSNARIVIGNADLAAKLISGAFDADDPESFALFLAAADIAVAERRPGGTLLLRPAKPPKR